MPIVKLLLVNLCFLLYFESYLIEASLFPKGLNDHIFQNYVFIDRIDGAKPLSKRRASGESTFSPMTTVTPAPRNTKGKKPSKLHKLKLNPEAETLPVNSVLTITKGDEGKEVLGIHDGSSVITENIEPAIEEQEWIYNEQIEEPLVVHSTSKLDSKVTDDLIKLIKDYQDNIFLNQEQKKIIGFSDPDTKVLHITGMNQNNKPGAISLHLLKEDENTSSPPPIDSLNPVNSINIPQLKPKTRPTREPKSPPFIHKLGVATTTATQPPAPPLVHHLGGLTTAATQPPTPPPIHHLEVPSPSAAQEQNPPSINQLVDPSQSAAQPQTSPLLNRLEVPSPPAAQEQNAPLLNRLEVPSPPAAQEQNAPLLSHLEVPSPPAAQEQNAPLLNNLEVPSQSAAQPQNSPSLHHLVDPSKSAAQPQNSPSLHHLVDPSKSAGQSENHPSLHHLADPSKSAAQSQDPPLLHHLVDPSKAQPQNPPLLHHLADPSQSSAQPQNPPTINDLVDPLQSAAQPQDPPTIQEVPPLEAPQPQPPAVDSPPALSVQPINFEPPPSQVPPPVPLPPQTQPARPPPPPLQPPVKQPTSPLSSPPLTPPVRKLTPISPQVPSSQTFNNEPLKIKMGPPLPIHINKVPQKLPKTQLPLENVEDEEKHRNEIARAFAQFVLSSLHRKKTPAIIKESAPKQVIPIDKHIQNKKNFVKIEEAVPISKHTFDPKQPSPYKTIEEEILAILQDRQHSSNDENLRHINVLPHQKIIELPQDNFENIIINGETVKSSPDNYDFIDDCEQPIRPVKLEPVVHPVRTQLQVLPPVQTVHRAAAPPLYLRYTNQGGFGNCASHRNNEEEEYRKAIYREPQLTYYKYDSKEYDLVPASSQQISNTPNIKRLPTPHRQSPRQTPQVRPSQQSTKSQPQPMPAREPSREPSRQPSRQPPQPIPLRQGLPLREPLHSREQSRLPPRPLPPPSPQVQQKFLLRRYQLPTAAAPRRTITYPIHRQEQSNRAQFQELEDMDSSIEEANDDEYLENLLNSEPVPSTH